MQKKSDIKKDLIKTVAKQLFSTKGYEGVTMKDVCEACQISRGGLYRYYDSPKEIMCEILTDDKTEMASMLEQAIEGNVPALQLLNYFLEMIRSDIQCKENRFSFVIHEFAFVEPTQSDYMEKRFESAVQILSRLLDYGKRTHEFKDFDTRILATHITLFRDSIITSSASLKFSDTLIDEQLNYIKESVIRHASK
ncbi:transcriptional regulator [Sphaerochaeta pleomorpha str. Grapes]|uniref:Transcriptional regulator n=1 Tax=Sphaerochaeta pleomorpha (strain ATCC BAA-1885 / DSM 22778 / Grapes) TaxID=158190 RepID=G8QX46_SPHPG|nr:TetR/AcrR family transcriptional regulator [Sphaerochaeta pleomorpha]AEV30631.1 transcriptional regulator [Sphaerochaeta pleomorpha str. Grapes]